MKKDVRKGKNPKLQEELSQITNLLADKSNLSEDNQKLLNVAVQTLYKSAEIVFNLVPKMSSIHLEAKEMKPEHAMKVKYLNKRREFIVRRKGQKNLELWAVKGVKNDSQFLKLWSEQGELSVDIAEDVHIGFLYEYLGQGKTHEVTLDDGSKLLVAGKDTRDVSSMVKYAIEKNLISAKSFDIRFYDMADEIGIYSCGKTMDEVSGGVHHNHASSGHFDRKFSILQFEDFRDGKHKER